MNIRQKTEQERVVDILMKLSEEDQSILLNYIKTNLMVPSGITDDGYDYAAEKEYDPYWPTQGCEA